jgi:acetyltransferase
LQKLDALLPATWSRANPVDIIGDAPIERYVQALQVLTDDPAAGAVLMMHAPTAIVPSADIARALLPLSVQQPPRVMGCWLGEQSVLEARQIFQDANIASFVTPEQAVRAFGFGVTYRRNQAQLLESPGATRPGPAADSAAVRTLVQQLLAEGREMLSESEAKSVLAAYGIPVVATRGVGNSPQAAVDAALEMGFPVALKILSHDISHKSDVGGVALDLESAQAVRLAALAMLERVQRVRPEARIQGFTVQSMVRRGHALELIVGASIDSVFGPVILFGQGGTAVEVVADRAVALPPLNVPLARALVDRTRVAKLLKGFRGTPPVDLDALYGVLVAISQLLADVPQIAELDINPLLADDSGVLALDARIRLSAAAPGGAHNFAIRPYPARLIQALEWKGRALTLRPIRPEDEAQHLAFLARLDPEDIRMRVFYSRRSIKHTELARLTQIDYEREMAFVAVAAKPKDAAAEQTLGVVRAIADPDNIAAEFGIIIRSDLKGGGLGRILMDKMIRYARDKGTQRLVGTVIAENKAMLELARELGFVQSAVEPGQPCEVVLELN